MPGGLTSVRLSAVSAVVSTTGEGDGAMGKETEPALESLSSSEVATILAAAYGRFDESRGSSGVQDEFMRRKVERRSGWRSAITASALAGAVAVLGALLMLATCSE